MIKNLLQTRLMLAWLPVALAGAALWLTPCPALATDKIKIWDVARNKEITLEAAVVVSARARLITVGEFHDSLNHHLAQLAVIKAYSQAGIPVAVGLEMWRQTDQKGLDDWLAGKIDEAEMARRLDGNWSRGWPLYKEIFIYCRDRGLEMVALNLTRELTRKVAAKGYGALTEEEKELVPPLSCELEPDYKAYLKKVFDKHLAPKKAHAKKGGAKPSKGHGAKFKKKHGVATDFNSFCLAQVAWDAAMARRAVRYLEDEPEKTMVVIAGMTHAARYGIPYQAARLDKNLESKVFQPQVTGYLDRNHVKISKCDFLVMDLDQAFGGPDAEGGADDIPI